MQGTPASPGDKSIEPVLIECPSCKTKISSTAQICYSCRNPPDRALVDEQVARILDEKRKREAKKAAARAQKPPVPASPAGSKPAAKPATPSPTPPPPPAPASESSAKPDTAPSPPPLRPADSPVSVQPSPAPETELAPTAAPPQAPVAAPRPLPPPPPDWPQASPDDPDRLVPPPPVGLLQLKVDVMPIHPSPDDFPATGSGQPQPAAQPPTQPPGGDAGTNAPKTPLRGMMTCPGCSTEVSVTALMCYSCGKRLREQTESTESQQVYAYESRRPASVVPPPSNGNSDGMRVICEDGHIMACDPANIPATCPVCGSKRLTYIAGELKTDNKSGMFGRKGGVTGVSFKRNDRMDELEKKYGRGY